MNRTKSALMITLFACMSQGKNHYSKVSIDKIRELLGKYHGIHVERRWIFYCMKYLLENNLISSKLRFNNDDSGRINQKPSLHSFTIPGVRYLVSKKVKGAWKLLKAMLKHVMLKDGRWPGKKDIAPAGELNRFVPTKNDWEELLGIVTKNI